MAEGYSIVKQTPKMAADAANTIVPSVEVTFVTKPSGQPGRVVVPQSQFTPANVDRIVAAEAKNIEAVQNL